MTTRVCVISAFHLILQFSICSSGDVQSAHMKIPAIAKYFGTKGRYEEVNPYLVDEILYVNKSNFEPPSLNCNAIHLTVILRHGTRYPSTKNIKNMENIYNIVVKEANGSERWLQDLKTNWKMWYNESMDGRLVEKGRNDHRHLAVRLAKSFPTLISEANLRNNGTKFVTSAKHRCIESIVAFKQGLKNFFNIKDLEFAHEENNYLMRFFDTCERFVHDVADNTTALKEMDLFKSRPEMRRVQEKMADRLQVPYSRITADLAEAAYLLCAYDFAIKTENSPWCSMFDETDAQVMEYSNDLKQFWKRGYGHDINRKSSCSLFHDLFSRLDRIANSSNAHATEAFMVQMGHADTLLPFLSLLGFFKDELPLTSDSYAAHQNRAFRSGRIVPYAANLVMVLYNCTEGVRLQALLNEKPLMFPNISQRAPLYSTVRQVYQELLQGCNFKKECQLPQPKSE